MPNIRSVNSSDTRVLRVWCGTSPNLWQDHTGFSDSWRAETGLTWFWRGRRLRFYFLIGFLLFCSLLRFLPLMFVFLFSSGVCWVRIVFPSSTTLLTDWSLFSPSATLLTDWSLYCCCRCAVYLPQTVAEKTAGMYERGSGELCHVTNGFTQYRKCK